MVSGGQPAPVPYQPGMFDYGANNFGDKLPDDLGFAGFRIHYPLNRPDYFDELAVYLGASYFRILGRNQIYGASARGLAVDTAATSGEDFPRFREFWIEEPGADATRLTIYALLDSRSATGAYRFVLTPGTDTQAEVTASVYPRRDIGKLGMAPLTSMFFFGENRGRGFDDFRPEVHDSDGLQMETGQGEWIWRPLLNPKDLRVSSFTDENPRRFGLIQRDRDFLHYQDLESSYHRRPSYWVEPVGDWGKGRVELVEIPTDEEINDNIVAYWVPERAVRGGEGLDFSYRLRSVLDSPETSAAGPRRLDQDRQLAGAGTLRPAARGPALRARLRGRRHQRPARRAAGGSGGHHQFRRAAPAHRPEEHRDRRLAGLLRPAARKQAGRPALRPAHARPAFD